MKLSRETLLGISLLIIVFIVAIAVALNQSPGELPPLASYSNSPDGALALKLWVNELGYPLDEEILGKFELPASFSIVFTLQPDLITDAELQALDEFIRNGGTLIAAGDSLGMTDLASHFGFQFESSAPPVENAILQTPLLTSPVILQPIPVHANWIIRKPQVNFVPLVATAAGPVVILYEMGSGRLILSSTPYPFMNQGLKVEGNPALVLNLLAAAHREGSVWFDDWHHGERAFLQASGPEEWLRHTPGGYAVIFTVVVIFLALLLQGRLLGRPVPQAGELRRRGPIDHLTAIANLNRRAGHRAAILGHYRQQIKKQIGHRYQLDPALPDDAFIERLSRFNSGLDLNKLHELLRSLCLPSPTEAEMVRLAAEAAGWLEE